MTARPSLPTGQFHLPRDPAGRPKAYLAGHSLGLQPVTTAENMRAELDRWAREGVAGHFSTPDPWYAFHETVQEPLARLVGAQPHEAIMMNSLTANLHLLFASFYRPRGQRRRILFEAHAFPSDRFALETQVRWHGGDPAVDLVPVRPRQGESHFRHEDLIATIAREGEQLAMVWLPGVDWLTGEALDLAGLTRAAHEAGAIAGFDLAHAVGNMPLKLHDSNIDFAVWCSYKYLNSGPGSVGGAFVHERHHNRPDLLRLGGWWGHDPATRFAEEPPFQPQPGVEGWQLSNAPVLSMVAVRASLGIFDRVGIDHLHDRAIALTDHLRRSLANLERPWIRVLTPESAARRGAMTCIALGERATPVHAALEAAGIVCDLRAPDVLRLAAAPLYNDEADLDRCLAVLEQQA
ncbi:MAG: kynureninase [Candidatus Sericytochromatia bacterium]|nr:kynureninase [Candidatus Tanganyikabacteria bacterium]